MSGVDEPSPPFNELLRTHRERLNLSQRDVAKALDRAGHDYTSQTLGNWERGRSVPPREVVIVLEDILECPGVFTAALGLVMPGRSPIELFADRLDAIEVEAEAQRELIAELRGLVERQLGQPRSDRADS